MRVFRQSARNKPPFKLPPLAVTPVISGFQLPHRGSAVRHVRRTASLGPRGVPHTGNTGVLVILVKMTWRNRRFPAQGSWRGYLPPVLPEVSAPVPQLLNPEDGPALTARVTPPFRPRVPVEVRGPLWPPVRAGVRAGLRKELLVEVSPEVPPGIRPRIPPEVPPRVRAGTRGSSGVSVLPCAKQRPPALLEDGLEPTPERELCHPRA
jgi:hypothetical protein